MAKLQSALHAASYRSWSLSEATNMLISSLWKSPASSKMDFTILSDLKRDTKQVAAASLISLF